MRSCKTVNFAVPADRRIKLKECEKKDKYLDLARKLNLGIYLSFHKAHYSVGSLIFIDSH